MRRALLLLLAFSAAVKGQPSFDEFLRSYPADSMPCATKALALDENIAEAKKSGGETGQRLLDSAREGRLRFHERCMKQMVCPEFYVAADAVDPYESEFPTFTLWSLARDLCAPDPEMTLLNQ